MVSNASSRIDSVFISNRLEDLLQLVKRPQKRIIATDNFQEFLVFACAQFDKMSCELEDSARSLSFTFQSELSELRNSLRGNLSPNEILNIESELFFTMLRKFLNNFMRMRARHTKIRYALDQVALDHWWLNDYFGSDMLRVSQARLLKTLEASLSILDPQAGMIVSIQIVSRSFRRNQYTLATRARFIERLCDISRTTPGLYLAGFIEEALKKANRN